MGSGWGVRVDVIEELKFWEKLSQKQIGGGGRGALGGVRWGVGLVGGQGGYERRIEVFVKIQKKNWGGGSGAVGSGGGGVGYGVVMMDVNEELKFFGKIHKKKIRGGREGRGQVRGSGWQGGGQVRCERNVGGRG